MYLIKQFFIISNVFAAFWKILINEHNTTITPNKSNENNDIKIKKLSCAKPNITINIDPKINTDGATISHIHFLKEKNLYEWAFIIEECAIFILNLSANQDDSLSNKSDFNKSVEIVPLLEIFLVFEIARINAFIYNTIEYINAIPTPIAKKMNNIKAPKYTAKTAIIETIIKKRIMLANKSPPLIGLL